MRKYLIGTAILLQIALAPALPKAHAADAAKPAGKSCTAGYSPCLVYHHGADYDCAGGGGNGPYYTKAGVVYRVRGSDRYRLDSNNNGKGCE